MAGGPGGKEVGRVSVRVTPDTSRFDEELKAKLEALERKLKGHIPVEADFDPDGLKQKVRAAAKAAETSAKVKGDMDIELAVDMMEMAERLDHAVLFSGNGDFRRLVEAVQRKGVRVSVVSTIRSQPPMIADELRRQADTFLELGELMPQIQRAVERREISNPANPDRYLTENEPV